MTFAQKLKENAPIYFIRTTDEEARAVYYVLQVSPTRQIAFSTAMKTNKMVDYTSFGEIIASGFGHVPSPENDAMLQRDYHYDYRKALT